MIKKELATRGFTLVELLVVLAIIGLLIGLLLPAIQMGREAARRANCCSNLKNIGLAIANFHENRGHYPAGVYDNGMLNHSWCTHILPYLEQSAVFEKINLSLPFDDPKNLWIAASSDDSIFRCPNTQSVRRGLTDYGGLIGSSKSGDWRVNNGFFLVCDPRVDRFLTSGDISDGLSNTIMVGESTCVAGLYEVLWLDGWNCFFANGVINKDLSDLKSFHPGGVNVVFADCGVRFLSETISSDVLSSFITRDGGETFQIPQ